jgi:hypothetical protein
LSSTNIQPVSIQSRLIPLSKWANFYPWPTYGMLRAYVFNAEANGADVWIVRVGKRVLVREDRFFPWAETIGDRALRKIAVDAVAPVAPTKKRKGQ